MNSTDNNTPYNIEKQSDNSAQKPLILISNDDGVDAPGLHRLIETVKDLGEVWAVAPDSAKSGQSSAFTTNGPLRIKEHEIYDGARVLSVSGTPVDCVKLAMHCIVPRKPDLLLSGINHGSNAGNSVIYSGTMGAVFEGCMQGIASVGYSLLHHSWKADFSECLPLIREITSKVIAGGLPEGICLNVNFPAKVKIRGVRTVRAARSYWTDEYQGYTDPHGKPFYMLTGRQVNTEPGNDATDLYWLDRHYATIVPCTASQNAPEIETNALAAVFDRAGESDTASSETL